MPTSRWAEDVQNFERWQLEAGIAPSTIRRRGFPLRRFAARVAGSLEQTTDADIERFMAAVATSYALRSARDSLASFYRWAELSGRCAFPDALVHATRMRADRAIEHGVGRDVRWSVPVTQWLDWLRAGGQSREMVKLRTYQVTRLSRELAGQDPWAVGADDLAAWLADYPDWSRETLRSYRSMLRSFYGWAHAAGHIKVDPSRLLRKVPTTQARPRPAAEAVVEQALTVADDRSYLAIMLGAHAGMRRAEIARVHTDDLLRDATGWSLHVRGKGERERVVPLLDEIAARIREAPPGWVFPNGRGGHLAPATLGRLLRGVLAPGTTPHQLRHRFASTAYQATGDIRAVQELLGHASVATTQVYTAVGSNALRSAVLAAARRGP